MTAVQGGTVHAPSAHVAQDGEPHLYLGLVGTDLVVDRERQTIDLRSGCFTACAISPKPSPIAWPIAVICTRSRMVATRCVGTSRLTISYVIVMAIASSAAIVVRGGRRGWGRWSLRVRAHERRLGRMGRCRARRPSAAIPLRSRALLVPLLFVAALLAPMLMAPAAQGSPTRRPHVRVLAPGVALTTYIDRRIPVRAYVLWIDPSQGASLGMALAHDQLGEAERTSDIAKDHGALVAVNGDLGFGRPVHPFALNGDLVQTSPALGAMLSISSDGTMRIGKPTAPDRPITEVDTGETWPIASWNHGATFAGRADRPHSRGRRDRGAPSVHVLGATASGRTVRRDRRRLDQDLQRGPGRVLLEPAPARRRRRRLGGAHDRRSHLHPRAHARRERSDRLVAGVAG